MKPDRRSTALVDAFLLGRIDRRQLLRRAVALGLTAPVAAALAARTAGPALAQDPGFGNTANGPQAERLVLWTRATPDHPTSTEFQRITNIANAYTEQTGTPIEIATVPNDDFKNKIGIAAPGGEGPDVYGPIAHDWIGEFAVQGIAAEIPADLIQGPEDLAPFSIQAATFEGKLSALPVFVESIGLIYNKDLVPTPPATWEELVAKATELTSGDVYGFGFPLLEQYHEGAFVYGFGGYVFKPEGGTFVVEDVGLNNEGGVTAAKFLRDMFHQQKPPLPPVAIDRTNMHTQQEGMMEAGQLAMTFNGPWREDPLRAAGINYGVAVLPTLPGGNPMRPFLGVQCWAASSYSKNPEAALDFVSFATGTNSALELYRGSFKAPVRQSVLATQEVAQNPNIPTWAAQAANGTPMPNVPAMTQVWKPWGDAMDAIIPNNAPDDEVKSLLDSAAGQIADAIEEFEEG